MIGKLDTESYTRKPSLGNLHSESESYTRSFSANLDRDGAGRFQLNVGVKEPLTVFLSLGTGALLDRHDVPTLAPLARPILSSQHNVWNPVRDSG